MGLVLCDVSSEIVSLIWKVGLYGIIGGIVWVCGCVMDTFVVLHEEAHVLCLFLFWIE